MHRFWQQSELTTAVARMEDQGVPIRLQPAQMLELAKATHEATHNLGKGLRRELLRTTSNLRDAHPDTKKVRSGSAADRGLRPR